MQIICLIHVLHKHIQIFPPILWLALFSKRYTFSKADVLNFDEAQFISFFIDKILGYPIQEIFS